MFGIMMMINIVMMMNLMIIISNIMINMMTKNHDNYDCHHDHDDNINGDHHHAFQSTLAFSIQVLNWTCIDCVAQVT